MLSEVLAETKKMHKKILFIFGTRPEAIKMAPVIKTFTKNKDNKVDRLEAELDIKVCVTGQHRQMLDQVLSFFEIVPDYDLDLMKQNQSLFEFTANCLKSLEYVLDDFRPDLIFVQGDTVTAFVGALAGFYKKIKIAHVEAGLRSFNKYSPFPEEINRILAGHIADYHFAPTETAKENLFNENIKENVWVVGNTVIDALFLGLKLVNSKGNKNKYEDYFRFLDLNKKIILVTGHRRESFGEGFDIEPGKIELAKSIGIDYAFTDIEEFKNTANKFTNGFGVDAVLITAATKSDEPVNIAVEISRYGGKVVIVGVADIHPDRNEMWHKEVEIIVSKAAGPGSLDPLYENKGIDYPIGYIRWTENRNLEEFIRLVSVGKIKLNHFITHKFNIKEAEDVYKNILENKVGSKSAFPNNPAPITPITTLPCFTALTLAFKLFNLSFPRSSGKTSLG